MEAALMMRRASEADRAAVISLSRAISEHDWIPNAYDHFMAEPEPAGLYLCEQGGQLVGCFHVEFPAPDDAYFSAMRIHPESQGKGFGAWFCGAQVAQARELGAEQIFLLSQVDNAPAHRTVQKNGFVNLGEWVVFGGMDFPGKRLASRARQALPEESSVFEQRLEASGDSLSGIVCTGRSPYVTMRFRPHDVDPADLLLADDGYLWVTWRPDGPLIRSIDGSPAAAEQLLARLAAGAEERGFRSWSAGLPARQASLLRWLEPDPSEAFRAFLFRHA